VVSARVRRLATQGFGLVELLVSLSLLALLSLLAAPPLMNSWRTAALRAATAELASAITHGRLLAISLNTPVCVAVERGLVRFEVPGGGACSGTPVAATAGQMVKLSGDALVSANGPPVVFTHLGAAAPAGAYTVSDQTGGRTRRVVVAVSGRVSVQ
jgi:prepilin-type N-terminal cleavage/methylation domain-containing protein